MSVGVAGGLESFDLEFGEEEAIKRVLGPRGVLDGRSGRVRDRLEGPEFPAGNDVDDALRFGGLGGVTRSRIRCAAFNPFFEDGDFVRGQPAFRGHREILVEIAHSFDDEALREVARDDRRSVVAAVSPAGARVEREAAFGFLVRRMAVVAPLDQHRAHLRLEEQVIVTGGQEGQRRQEQGGDGAEAGHFA